MIPWGDPPVAGPDRHRIGNQSPRDAPSPPAMDGRPPPGGVYSSFQPPGGGGRGVVDHFPSLSAGGRAEVDGLPHRGGGGGADLFSIRWPRPPPPLKAVTAVSIFLQTPF